MLIMMSSRPEHWLVDLAAVHLGAVPSTIYPTLSTDQLRYLALHSAAQVLVLKAPPSWPAGGRSCPTCRSCAGSCWSTEPNPATATR